MSEEKGDLRIVRTKAAIRDAFSQLLDEKGTERITVKELADLAGINRKTFYLHYPAIDDLYQEAVDEVLDDFLSQHETTPEEPKDISGHAIRFFKYLASQEGYTEKLICNSSPFDFGRKLYFEQMNRYRAFGNPFGWMDEGKQDLVLHFIRATALDFYRGWVLNGKKVEANDAAELLAELTCNGISGLMKDE